MPSVRLPFPPLLLFRQQCSPVAPGLFVSGHEISANLSVLQGCGVTCVINVASDVFPCPFEADGLAYVALGLSDSPSQDVYSLFPLVIQVRHLRRGVLCLFMCVCA